MKLRGERVDAGQGLLASLVWFGVITVLFVLMPGVWGLSPLGIACLSGCEKYVAQAESCPPNAVTRVSEHSGD